MGDIVSLSKPERRVWVCDCGCSTFLLLSDGTAECAACDAPADVDGSGWSKWTAESRHEEGEAFADIQGNGSVEFARRRVAQMASADDAAALVVIRRDGRISTWSEAETEKQFKWVKRKLKAARDLICRKEP